MSDNLRAQVIRLAHAHPEFRKDLLSVLAADKEAGTYQEYVDRKKKKNEKPLSEQEWEAYANPGGEAAKKMREDNKQNNKSEKAPQSKGDGKAPEKTEKAAPARSFKKTYHKNVESVMEKHELTDDDADQVKKFKGNKPSNGRPVSPQEMMRRFLAKAKPETKERMKGMSPADFMKMLAAISEEEEGGGKTASDSYLRHQVIRLAHAHPEFRKDLMPLLKGASFDAESIGELKPGGSADGVKDSDADKPWIDGEFSQQENMELQQKQESGELAKGKAEDAPMKVAKVAYSSAIKAGKSKQAAVEAARLAVRSLKK